LFLASNATAEGDAADANVSVAPATVKPASEPKAGGIDDTGQLPVSPPAKPKTPDSPANTAAAAKTAGSAKPLVVTEVVTPVADEKAGRTSSAQFVVRKANADAAERSVTVKPAATTPASPAAETGIPVTAVAGEDAPEPDVAPTRRTQLDDGVEPASETTRSTARFIVAKAGSTEAAPTKGKPDPVPQSVSSASTPEPDTVQAGTESAKVVPGTKPETAAYRAPVDCVPTGGADKAAPHADGARPVAAEGQQAAPVQVEHSVRGSERANPEPERTAPPGQTTVKTIAIDTVKGVRYLLTKGEHTMRIRLVPESLGELRLVVTSSSDEVSIRLASASHTVRELLHTQVQHLREALSQDGANVGKITVTADMSAGTGTGNPHTGSPDRAWNPNGRDWTGHAPSSPKYPSSMGQQPVVVPRQAMPHPGTLNLFA